MTSMPNNVSPMLAKTSVTFPSEDYVYEVKWDGIRVIAFVEDGRITKPQSRSGRGISRQFPS